ncbi:MAG: DUF4255 domain-containing protein [Chloroflexota bacterium]
MLQDVDKTLEKILRDKGKIPKRDIDIEFDQPTGEWSASLSRPTLNIFAFDMRENTKLRRTGFEQERMANNRVRMTRPPSRIDVAYLVTAWARKVEDEHQLLWRALRTLKSIQVIKPGDGEGDFRSQTYETPVWVADMSAVNTQYNLTDVWSVMENQMKLGFLMILTLDLNLDFAIDAPLVLEGTFTIDQVVTEAETIEDVEKDVLTTREGVIDRDEDDNLSPDIRIIHRGRSTDNDNGS